MKRLIVAGSRSFADRKFLWRTMDKLTIKLDDLVVLTGGAAGADRLGEEWALANGFQVEQYLPDYQAKGKGAPPARNQEMVDGADILIAFHVGDSPGTRDVIRRAREKGLVVRVFNVLADNNPE